MQTSSSDYYRDHATADELSAVLGTNRWAIARKTPANLARYERCLTPKEYAEATKRALAARDINSSINRLILRELRRRDVKRTAP